MLNYCLLIQTDQFFKSKNVYEDFYKWKDLFDFSNFSEDSKFYKSKSDKSKNNNNYDNKDQ